jgi:hypothetical protein
VTESQPKRAPFRRVRLWGTLALLAAALGLAAYAGPSLRAGPVRQVTILYTGYGQGATLPVAFDSLST